MARGNGQTGRPPKIGDTERREIIAVVATGGSLNDAADVVGIARDTLNRHLRENPAFRKGVDRAIAKGKIRLIKKVKNGKPWQAAAWMLERKFGEEYGKRDKVDIQHAGTVTHNVRPMMEKVLADPAALASARLLVGRAASLTGMNSENGENGHNGNGSANGHH
jgi:transposase